MTSKEYFFNEVLEEAVRGTEGELRVLELGCGTAGYVPAMIEAYPNLTYVGVEPIPDSFAMAKENLKDTPRTELYHQLGYDGVEGLTEASYDVVISFSVLEHVKQLERFIAMGEKYLKKGGLMVHRYDLGHALYPGHLKERFHVFLGNTVPAILPERQFVRYVPLEEVEGLFKKHLGTTPYRRTHHQVQALKTLEKNLIQQHLPNSAPEDIYVWEFKHAATFDQLPVQVREQIFPTVAVWGRKA